VSVRRDHVLWRKEHEKSLDEVGATLVFTSSLGLRTGLAQTQSAKEPAKAISITGCLVRGDEPKEVWLAEKDGTIYGLESSKIELIAHLGHKVIVRGYVLPEGKEQPGEEAHKQNKTGKGETADFRVLTLKMISTTCTQ
jgi:hypothetical protein